MSKKCYQGLNDLSFYFDDEWISPPRHGDAEQDSVYIEDEKDVTGYIAYYIIHLSNCGNPVWLISSMLKVDRELVFRVLSNDIPVLCHRCGEPVEYTEAVLDSKFNPYHRHCKKK